jgi:hypothetical protein
MLILAELSAQLTITAVNLGATGSGVFKEKIGAELQFKKLVSGTKMALDDTGDTIVINSTAADAFVRIDTDSGNVQASANQNITFSGAAAPNL